MNQQFHDYAQFRRGWRGYNDRHRTMTFAWAGAGLILSGSGVFMVLGAILYHALHG